MELGKGSDGRDIYQKLKEGGGGMEVRGGKGEDSKRGGEENVQGM